MVLLTRLLTLLLPLALLTRIINWNFGRRATPSNVETTVDLLNPEIVRNATYMAHNELIVVKELQVEKVRRVLPKLRFYFGTVDKWCPLRYVILV